MGGPEPAPGVATRPRDRGAPARWAEVRAEARRAFGRWVRRRAGRGAWVPGGARGRYLEARGVDRPAWPSRR